MSTPTTAPTPVGFLGNHFEQTRLEVTIARDALTDAADFVRAQAPAPQAANGPLDQTGWLSPTGITRAADDPHVILRFGQFRARLHAAEGLLARATRLANASGWPAPAAPTTAAPSRIARDTLTSPTTLLPAAAPSRSSSHTAPTTGATPTASPPAAPPPSAAAVLVALLEAQAFASDLITEIAAQLIAWGAPPTPSQQRRGTPGPQGPHTATHWNYHHAGNYHLKGITPPTPASRP